MPQVSKVVKDMFMVNQFEGGHLFPLYTFQLLLHYWIQKDTQVNYLLLLCSRFVNMRNEHQFCSNCYANTIWSLVCALDDKIRGLVLLLGHDRLLDHKLVLLLWELCFVASGSRIQLGTMMLIVCGEESWTFQNKFV